MEYRSRSTTRLPTGGGGGGGGGGYNDSPRSRDDFLDRFDAGKAHRSRSLDLRREQQLEDEFESARNRFGSQAVVPAAYDRGYRRPYDYDMEIGASAGDRRRWATDEQRHYGPAPSPRPRTALLGARSQEWYPKREQPSPRYREDRSSRQTTGTIVPVGQMSPRSQSSRRGEGALRVNVNGRGGGDRRGAPPPMQQLQPMRKDEPSPRSGVYPPAAGGPREDYREGGRRYEQEWSAAQAGGGGGGYSRGGHHSYHSSHQRSSGAAVAAGGGTMEQSMVRRSPGFIGVEPMVAPALQPKVGAAAGVGGAWAPAPRQHYKKTFRSFWKRERESRGDESYGYEYAEEGEVREKYTMLEFALLYFRPPRGEKRKDWSWKEVAKRVMWTDRPIQQSLLRLEGAEANKLACDVFLNVMKFMGDEPLKKGESVVDIVYRLFMMMKRLEILRDEAYCQILRQTTNNRSESGDSAVRGWRLLIILTSFFDCSTHLKPYLMKHLIDVANDSRRSFHGTAQQCIANLSKTFKYGGRKFLLSAAEINEISKGKTIKRQTYHVPGGHTKVVNTTSVTVVEDVIKELCSDLNIRSPSEQQEFVLCAVLENVHNEVHFAKNDEYVLDIATELDHKKTGYSFHLRRAVWLHPLRLDSALYIDCMFYQILPDYQTGLLVSPQNNGHFSAATLDDIAKLAAYVYLANEEYRQHAIDERMVLTLLPQTALASRIITADSWIERIERKLRGMDTAISVAHARAAFLEMVESWPSFGAQFTRVLCSNEHEREIAETVISVNRSGLRLLSGDNYRTLSEYALSAIGPVTTFSRNNTDFLDITVRGAERDLRMTIQSEKAADIARLIGHYLFVYKTSKQSITADAHKILH